MSSTPADARRVRGSDGASLQRVGRGSFSPGLQGLRLGTGSCVSIVEERIAKNRECLKKGRIYKVL